MGQGSSVQIPGGGTEGYHVLRVQDNSPGQKAGLEPYFDYILTIGDVRLKEDNEQLKELLKENEDKPVKMTVYSSKYQECRGTDYTRTDRLIDRKLMTNVFGLEVACSTLYFQDL
jgi:S1-C subfamily serine protease